MKVERIDNIHIIVKDLEAAAKFFSDLMGTRFFGPWDSVGLGDKVAFDNLGFELMQPTGPGEVAKYLKEHGEGVAWIALKVPNLDEAAAELRAKGIPVEYWRDYSEPSWKGDMKGAIVTDPEKTFGIVFELVEYENVQPGALANWSKISEIPRMQRTST